MLAYLLCRLAGIVAPRVPRRLGYALMALVAAVAYRFSAGNRRMIQCNLRRALGGGADPERVDQVARHIFHNLLKNYFDLFWLPAQSEETMARLITVHGIENAHDALTLGKGLIAVSAHMGNQEVMIQVRAITELKLTLVVEHVKNERVFRYLTSLRQMSGIHLIPHDGALKELFRALKRNEVIGLVFDRDIAGSGRIAPFFGQPARLPDGYAILALKLGAPVVPAFIVRQSDDSYAAYVEKPLRFEGRADNDEDVERVMVSVGKVVEDYITRFVDEWVYFHYIWEEDKGRGQIHRAQTTDAKPQ